MNVVARILSRIGPLAVAAGLAAPLGACVDLPKGETPSATLALAASPTNTAIDPNSAAAKDIARLEAEPTRYPSFQEIPAVPTDVRPSREWRSSVMALQAAGNALTARTAPSTWTLDGTDAFAANVRGSLDARASAPPTAAEIAESAAFVKATKARATPPPRPH